MVLQFDRSNGVFSPFHIICYFINKKLSYNIIVFFVFLRFLVFLKDPFDGQDQE